MIDRIINRELFLAILDLEVERAKRYQNFFCILKLKLSPLLGLEGDDGFNACRKTLGEFLPEELRGSDILSFLGGNQWAVMIPYADLSSANLLMSRLMGSLKYCDFKKKGYMVLADLISFPQDGSNTTDLVGKL